MTRMSSGVMAYRPFILKPPVVLRLPAAAQVLLNHCDTQMPAKTPENKLALPSPPGLFVTRVGL